jgi:hypothetical protein
MRIAVRSASPRREGTGNKHACASTSTSATRCMQAPRDVDDVGERSTHRNEELHVCEYLHKHSVPKHRAQVRASLACTGQVRTLQAAQAAQQRRSDCGLGAGLERAGRDEELHCTCTCANACAMTAHPNPARKYTQRLRAQGNSAHQTAQEHRGDGGLRAGRKRARRDGAGCERAIMVALGIGTPGVGAGAEGGVVRA